MPTRNICLLPPHWTAETWERDVSHRAHGHVRWKECVELERDGLGQWVIRHRVFRLRRRLSLRGLSARVGPYLALMVRRGEPWAQIMLREILPSAPLRSTK